ncbi:MAG: hypothetical protein JST20_08045 [Bacteroidetes bacterium]|nr:hypothetical protein [Bacteroidota bacterium]
MTKLTDIFSTRELSLLIWLTVLIITLTFGKEIRKSMLGVISAFFATKIVLVFALLTIYVGLIVFLLKSFSLLDVTLFKDTIFWFFSFAIVTFFSINKAKDIGFFKSILVDSFKWTIFLEFLVNFYTFSLTTELILFPFILIVTTTQAFSQTDKKNEQVTKLLTNILSIIVTAYFLYALYKTLFDYKNVFTLHNLNSLVLPLLLTTLLLPFYYLLAVIMQYEELFIRADFMTNDKNKSKLLKREILMTAKFNLNKIKTIKTNLNKFDFYHSTDIKQYIKTIK